MRAIAWSLILVVIGLDVRAQESITGRPAETVPTITLRKGLSRELWEIYQVPVDRRKVKNGEYKVEDNQTKVLARGQYKDGKRVGVWEFYDEGATVQKYDYSDGKIVYNVPDTLTMVKTDYSVSVPVSDGDTVVPPTKIGGVNYGFYLLFDYKDIPPQIKGTTENVQMTYVFTISKEGKLLDWTVLFAGPNVQPMTINEPTGHLPDDAYAFSPAMVNGTPVKSKLSYVIPILVDHVNATGTSNGNVTKHMMGDQ